jgi:hypothetical protein
MFYVPPVVEIGVFFIFTDSGRSLLSGDIAYNVVFVLAGVPYVVCRGLNLLPGKE